MKRSRSSVDSRRLDILRIIRQKDEVKVEELAEEFNLSLMTVRRDLQYLEDRRLITRFYGGATAKLTAILEPVLIILMALVIGFIMISVMLPIYSLYDQIGAGAGSYGG